MDYLIYLACIVVWRHVAEKGLLLLMLAGLRFVGRGLVEAFDGLYNCGGGGRVP